MRPTLDFNQPSRSTPVATDQKVKRSRTVPKLVNVVRTLFDTKQYQRLTRLGSASTNVPTLDFVPVKCQPTRSRTDMALKMMLWAIAVFLLLNMRMNNTIAYMIRSTFVMSYNSKALSGESDFSGADDATPAADGLV